MMSIAYLNSQYICSTQYSTWIFRLKFGILNEFSAYIPIELEYRMCCIIYGTNLPRLATLW